MAEEQRPGGEPTEPPSEKRLRDARLRGEVARSREVTSVAVFLAAAGALTWTWTLSVGELRGALAAGLRGAVTLTPSPAAALDAGLRTLLLASLPVLLAATLAALVATFAQVGPLFTLQPLRPSLGRLDLLRNARQVLGKPAAFELAKIGRASCRERVFITV